MTAITAVKRVGGSTKFETCPGGGGIPGSRSRIAGGRLARFWMVAILSRVRISLSYGEYRERGEFGKLDMRGQKSTLMPGCGEAPLLDCRRCSNSDETAGLVWWK